MSAKVFEFPAKGILNRAWLREQLHAELFSGAHDPTTAEKKLQSIMEVYDRSVEPVGHMVSMSLAQVEGDPFTDEQLRCINAAMTGIKVTCEQQIMQIFCEIAFLKCVMIDHGIE